MTFHSVSQSYLGWCRNVNQSEQTLECKTSVFVSQLNPYFNDKDLNTITPEDIEVFKQHIRECDYSYRYNVHIYSTLSSFLKWCVNQGLIEDNPFKTSISLPLDNPDQCEFWSESQFRRFISYFNHDMKWKVFFTLMFLTPIEHYELRTVCLEDIDLKEQTITINKRLRWRQKKGRRERVSKLKNQTIIHLNNECNELLRRYILSTKNLCYNFPLFPFSYTSVYTKRKESCIENNLKEIMFHQSVKFRKKYVLNDIKPSERVILNIDR